MSNKTDKPSSKKEDSKSKKSEAPKDDIVQPKADEKHTQESVKANAQKGEPVFVPGAQNAANGIEVELKEK